MASPRPPPTSLSEAAAYAQEFKNNVTYTSNRKGKQVVAWPPAQLAILCALACYIFPLWAEFQIINCEQIGTACILALNLERYRVVRRPP